VRERPEDLLPLALHYLQFLERRQNRRRLSFSPAAQQAIAAYSWPGNLRELRNSVERAVILSDGPTIQPIDLSLAEVEGPGAGMHPRNASALALGDDASLEEIEREHLARVVARAPSFEAAARILGIDVTTLQRKRKGYGLA
jgi:two-component system, NtrC family, response regulator AlgB